MCSIGWLAATLAQVRLDTMVTVVDAGVFLAAYTTGDRMMERPDLGVNGKLSFCSYSWALVAFPRVVKGLGFVVLLALSIGVLVTRRRCEEIGGVATASALARSGSNCSGLRLRNRNALLGSGPPCKCPARLDSRSIKRDCRNMLVLLTKEPPAPLPETPSRRRRPGLPAVHGGIRRSSKGGG